MNVPYNEKTHHIYETLARISREITAREEAEANETRKKMRKAKSAA